MVLVLNYLNFENFIIFKCNLINLYITFYIQAKVLMKFTQKIYILNDQY